MKTSSEVSADKLRGGFYSPQPLVAACLDRVTALTAGRRDLNLLEPSVGDGAFLRGLEKHPLRRQVRTITGVELLPAEATRARDELDRLQLPGQIVVGSSIRHLLDDERLYDVAVGNPPFVRYQFVPAKDREAAEELSARLAVPHKGVSNLWIPVLLASLMRVAPGGAVAFIVPAECFTGVSAGVVRAWLIRHMKNVRFDLFPPGSFPGVLQEVVILSGQRRVRPNGGTTELRVCEHSTSGTRTWTHNAESGHTWTRYLLTPAHLDAVAEASALADVTRLGLVVRFEVAAVTGANEYFSVDKATLDEFDLSPWAEPLLPRARHAPGLVFTREDYHAAVEAGANTFLLSFDEARLNPEKRTKPRSYLRIGADAGLPSRYKCRIREPWYRVPWIRPGALMLSKRCHRYPRVILNDASVVTTDTIYRGTMQPGREKQTADVVAAFHNSLTALSAEIEGRSFGGGVLELVPSEIARLVLPLPQGFGEELDRLDAVLRSSSDPEDAEHLLDETDLLLAKRVAGMTSPLMERLRDARLTLLQRRLDRNSSAP